MRFRGDTLLPENALMSIFAKRTGTNVALSDIKQAASDLQMEYRSRGYPTVNVTIPPQTITNGMVKIRVFEGRLSEILVTQNRYFSSNNVMRALPSLHTNIILVGPVFQAELDRANRTRTGRFPDSLSRASRKTPLSFTCRSRTGCRCTPKWISTTKAPPARRTCGSTPRRATKTSGNSSTPSACNTVSRPRPTSRENRGTSTTYPWWPTMADFTDCHWGRSARLRARSPNQSGNFGYDEATRKFRLPAPSGRPELNFYASRSTIDTGVTTLLNENLYNTNGNSLNRQDVQQGITINDALGARLSLPLSASANFQSGFSTGFDYKQYQQTNYKTNIFTLTSEILDTISNPGHVITNINVSTIHSPVPDNGSGSGLPAVGAPLRCQLA